MSAIAATIPAPPDADMKFCGRMSYEEFLVAPGFESTIAEWIDGEVYEMAPPSLDHQAIQIFLSTLLGLYLDQHRSGSLYPAPAQMKPNSTLPGREPDLLFVRTEHFDRLRRNHIEGPADLAIEIISPASRKRDRIQKFQEYQSGGVSEYWIIDPIGQAVEFFQLGEDRLYASVPVDANGYYASATIEGFRFKPEWIWLNPRPTYLEMIGA